MNLLLLEPEDLEGGKRACIGGRRLEHVRRVLGVEPGDEVRVGLVDGPLGRGRVCRLGESRGELEIVWEGDPPPAVPLELVLALPRPKVLRRLVAAVVSLGVKELHLIHAWRVEKSFWQSPLVAPGSLRRAAVKGLEQARDTTLPRIHRHRRFKPFAEDVLPALARGRRAFVAHPGASRPCPAAAVDASRRGLLAVGPEGGFLPWEVERLEAAGLEAVALGPRILTTETAVPVLVGRLVAPTPGRG